MLDNEPEIRRIFARIGQIVAFSQKLQSSLHGCCTAIFADQGFGADFAHAMMEQQDLPVLRKTWVNLIKDEFATDPDALAALEKLSKGIERAIRVRQEIIDTDWLSDDPKNFASLNFDMLPEPTISGGNLDFDGMVLILANLCAAVGQITTGWPTRDAALIQAAAKVIG